MTGPATRWTHVSVEELVRDVVERITPARRQEVVVEASGNVRALVDAAAIRTIVANLLENALTYGEPPVRVSVHGADDGTVTVAVEDRGRGVASHFVPHLFGAFTRSERSRLDGGGAGLGLAISALYARVHGGELSYEPAEPRGARFRLVLPPISTRVAPHEGAREQSPEQPAQASGASVKGPTGGAASASTRRWTRFFAATGVVACLVAQSASSRAANPAPRPTAAAPGGYFLDGRDVNRIRGNLRRYAWAREAWENTKSFAGANLDTMASPPDPNGSYAASPPARPNWSDDLYGPGLRDGRAAFELALAYRISGDRPYAAAAKAILLRWVTVYAHPPGVGGGVAPGHMVAEPLGPMVKLFIAADLIHETLAPSEASAVQGWARQWVAVGEANADSARDFAWVPDDTIGSFTSNQASYGNSALGQRAMALWAAAAAGPADLKRALAWNWSHVTRGGKPYGWSDLLDKLIIPGTGGETIEGRDRQSVGYGLFGWADLVLIADLAKHAGFKTNLFTYRTPSGNSLLSVGPFYGPIVGGTRADPYPEPESLGGGGYAAVLSKYRAVFETIHVNCTAGTLCAPFGAALHAVSPATRGDDYDPHLLGWNALLGVN